MLHEHGKVEEPPHALLQEVWRKGEGRGVSSLREYRCEYYTVMAPPTCCLFCDHCTDVFWDFSNGPYMFLCNAGMDTDDGAAGRCAGFSEGIQQDQRRQS